MGLDRQVRRRQKRDGDKMLKVAKATQQPHVLGSSQVEVLAAMRAIERSPEHDDSVDAIDHRRARNRRKRARREQRASS